MLRAGAVGGVHLMEGRAREQHRLATAGSEPLRPAAVRIYGDESGQPSTRSR